jgi:hypothetical protein
MSITAGSIVLQVAASVLEQDMQEGNWIDLIAACCDACDHHDLEDGAREIVDGAYYYLTNYYGEFDKPSMVDVARHLAHGR